MKHYRVVPNEVIKVGSFSYAFDPIKKTIDYTIKATVKKWFFTKEINESGTLLVNPADYLSEKFKNVGKVIKFGPLSVLIKTVKDNIAKGDIKSDYASLSGSSKYDLSEKYVVLRSVSASGNLMGVDFNLVLEKID